MGIDRSDRIESLIRETMVGVLERARESFGERDYSTAFTDGVALLNEITAGGHAVLGFKWDASNWSPGRWVNAYASREALAAGTRQLIGRSAEAKLLQESRGEQLPDWKLRDTVRKMLGHGIGPQEPALIGAFLLEWDYRHSDFRSGPWSNATTRAVADTFFHAYRASAGSQHELLDGLATRLITHLAQSNQEKQILEFIRRTVAEDDKPVPSAALATLLENGGIYRAHDTGSPIRVSDPSLLRTSLRVWSAVATDGETLQERMVAETHVREIETLISVRGISVSDGYGSLIA